MAYIVDDYQSKKLNKYNINIKTKYIVGNKILERNSNNSYCDDIISGIRCEKNYYLNNELKLTEKNFDSRIEYTYISKNLENKEYSCPNCGMTSNLKDFLDGCPYCKTYYNIDYTDKDLGSKYHYDRVLKNNIYVNLIASSKNEQDKEDNKKENSIRKYINDYDIDLLKMKKEMIKSPLANKYLERINYYGPYFSFCPSCRSKNLDYYNKMEPNQCIELIHFIKKERHKNEIMCLKKTSSVSPNKKSTIQKETLESENDINSKDGGDNSENEKLDHFV